MNSLRLIFTSFNYFAPVWVFSCLNILTGTWVLYLPYIKQKFALNDYEVGLALFYSALGLLISIPFAPYLNKKFGVGKSTKTFIIIYALLFNLPFLAPNYYWLCFSLVFTGAFCGLTDVSMNALVSNLEKKNNRKFMSAAHGFFSLGGFVGAGLGSILMLIISNPIYHMILISSLVITTTLLLSKHYESLSEQANNVSNYNVFSLNNVKPVIGLSILAFLIMLNEGAVEHWSNLFLFDIVQVSKSAAGLGFVVFSLTMTIGRFYGDWVSKMIGGYKTMSYGCFLAIIGYVLILFSNLYITVLGFGILGFGLSVIIPEIYRLAGQTKGTVPSVAISIVSGIGFFGFLIGPVLLGFISNLMGLISSYIILLFFVIIAAVLTRLNFKNKTNN